MVNINLILMNRIYHKYINYWYNKENMILKK